MAALLEVSDLCISFGPRERPVRAVSHVDLSIEAGEIVGIAGESGSGKTSLCGALIDALPRAARMSGKVLFAGRSIYDLSPRDLRALRGREISMVLQNPMTSLDPLFTIGNQLGEVLASRGGVAARDVRRRAAEVLQSVRLSAPDARLRQYPHELSGGMRQRVLIGMASATAPRLLIADEPTTALDATIQEEILLLLREIRDAHGTAIAIVTHDLGVIRRICDRIVVMYAGRIVEEGPVERIFTRPTHPYTRALLASIPEIDGDEVLVQAIAGQVPDLAETGDFCAFAARCPVVQEQCRKEQPAETMVGPAHRVFCFEAERPQ